MPCSPPGRGAHSLAEPPGDACSASKLCLILWFAQAEQTPSFPKVLENVWPKLSQCRGQAGGGLNGGCGEGVRPAPPSSGGEVAGHALFFELKEFFWLPSNLYPGFSRAQKRDPRGKVGHRKSSGHEIIWPRPVCSGERLVNLLLRTGKEVP